jgi:hypothetical protein
MKISDDYDAKYKLWAANPRVIPDSPPKNIPKFGPQKFRSHAEMNAWKESLLLEMAKATPRNE